MEALKGISILLALYGIYGMIKGEIYAKSGTSYRHVFRDEEPLSFWIVCICYIIGGAIIYFGISLRFG